MSRVDFPFHYSPFPIFLYGISNFLKINGRMYTVRVVCCIILYRTINFNCSSKVNAVVNKNLWSIVYSFLSINDSCLKRNLWFLVYQANDRKVFSRDLNGLRQKTYFRPCLFLPWFLIKICKDTPGPGRIVHIIKLLLPITYVEQTCPTFCQFVKKTHSMGNINITY